MRISVRPSAKINHSLGFSRIIDRIPDATKMRRSSQLLSLSPNDSIPGSLNRLNRKDNSFQIYQQRLQVRLRYRFANTAPIAPRKHKSRSDTTRNSTNYPALGSGILT